MLAHTTTACVFKWYATEDTEKSLRKQRPERSSGSFDPDGSYLSLRSRTAYSLPCTVSGACAKRASRVLLGGRPRRQNTMHDSDTTESAYRNSDTTTVDFKGGAE